MTDAINCYLGLGSNLGEYAWERASCLARALDLLGQYEDIFTIRPSSAYDTAPVGLTDQPHFLNMVAYVSSDLDPHGLLAVCKDIERRMGRQETVRWGPRNIDLDILLFGDLTIATDDLTIPHPRLRERQFVLIPLHEVAPDLVLPGGERVADLVDTTADVVWLGTLDDMLS